MTATDPGAQHHLTNPSFRPFSGHMVAPCALTAGAMMMLRVLLVVGHLQLLPNAAAGLAVEQMQLSQSATHIVKADFGGDKRRIPCDSCSFADLLQKLGAAYQVSADQIMARYLDEDRDLITIASDVDLAMAWEAMAGKSLLRVEVSLGKQGLSQLVSTAAGGEAAAAEVPQSDSAADPSATEDVSSRIEGLLAASSQATAAAQNAADATPDTTSELDEIDSNISASSDDNTTTESMERLMRMFLKHEVAVEEPEYEVQEAVDTDDPGGLSSRSAEVQELEERGYTDVIRNLVSRDLSARARALATTVKKISREVRTTVAKTFYAVGVISGRQEWVIDVHKGEFSAQWHADLAMPCTCAHD